MIYCHRKSDKPQTTNPNEWINVETRLPEESVNVLTLDLSNPDCPSYVVDYMIILGEGHYIWARKLAEDYMKVTHWMPLPRPPHETET